MFKSNVLNLSNPIKRSYRGTFLTYPINILSRYRHIRYFGKLNSLPLLAQRYFLRLAKPFPATPLQSPCFIKHYKSATRDIPFFNFSIVFKQISRKTTVDVYLTFRIRSFIVKFSKSHKEHVFHILFFSEENFFLNLHFVFGGQWQRLSVPVAVLFLLVPYPLLRYLLVLKTATAIPLPFRDRKQRRAVQRTEAVDRPAVWIPEPRSVEYNVLQRQSWPKSTQRSRRALAASRCCKTGNQRDFPVGLWLRR